jgi:hypothetical protein
MRIFGRFLYALLAVGLFLLAFTYSIDLTANKFYQEVFGASLTDEDSDLPDFYYFYTSIPDFHNSSPVVSINQNNYEVRAYEVATANIDEQNTLITEEFLYWIVYSDSENLAALSHLSLSMSDSEEVFTIPLNRFKNLNLLNGVNEEGNIYISKDLFLDNDFDKIRLVDKNENLMVESVLNIENADFVITENIEAFFQSYDRLPDQEGDLALLSNSNVGYRIIHINEDQILDGGIMLKAMLIYFGVLITTTYLIFFRKRKYE